MIPAPNGFFLHDLLWLDLPKGDALVVKGFRVELQDVSGASIQVLNALQNALSNLLYGLPETLHLQSQWQVSSDYREALNRYDQATASATNEWTTFSRAELHHRLSSQMAQGKLRREEHILWFTKHLATPLSKILVTAKSVERHLGILLEHEAQSFANLGRSLQQSLGAFASVTALDDLDNFISYRNFLNPSLRSQARATAALEFDPAATIQDLVFRSDAVRVTSENASFHFANRYQTLLVISRWPAKIRPLDVMALTHLPFNDYVITTNLIPKNTRAEISKEERLIERLEGEILSEKKRSLQTSKAKKERKVDELAHGTTRLFGTLQIIRVWDETPQGLSTKCEVIKAAISDMGAQFYHVTSATGARNLFMQTWPGNTHTKYRGYDIESSNQSLACLLPFSSTFTGLLDGAEALFHGATRNVIGFRSFIGSTPQHMLVLGGTGAGKSVAMNAILSQTEHLYDRTILIEEGYSYAMYSRTLGVRPIAIQLDGELTLNYLDTNGLPLSSHHIGTAAALCLKMVGINRNEDTNKHRLGIIGEYLNRLYEDVANDWFLSNPREIDALQRHGFALEHFRLQHQPEGSTFLDAYLAFKEQRAADPEDTASYLDFFSHEEILAWSKTKDGGQVCRNLVFARFEHRDYADLTHHSVYMALRYAPLPHHAPSEIQILADMLGTWTKSIGQRGKFFDGISNIQLDDRVLHFELSKIPEAAGDFKEAAGFLINNVVRHLIMTDPRSSRKRIIFEEAPRFFNVPGGDEIVAAAYATYRKYGAWLVTVAQQLSQIPEKLRPVLIGNSAIKIIFRQKSTTDLELLRHELRLPAVTVDTIRNYPSPEHLPAHDRYSCFTYWTESNHQIVNGTVRVYASPEMLYLASSDGDVVQEREEAMLQYANVLDGIQAEVAQKNHGHPAKPSSKARPKLMNTALTLIPLTILFFTQPSCSPTAARESALYGTGAIGGGALGYGLSDGNPLWTAAGTAGGIALAGAGNKLASKEVATAKSDGYALGQGDATRQHYWMLQSLQQSKNRDYGVTNTYDLTIPASEDAFGVKTVSRKATVRITE
jgi:type IV secretion system protein TrbE